MNRYFTRVFRSSFPFLLGFLLFGSILLGEVFCRHGLAQSPGVPAVPILSADSAGYDYVSYAVDDLPSYFQPNTDVGNANNTPANNPITNTGAMLGRALFYDQRLSHNDSTSCASCHHQENGFSDPDQFSVGFEGGLTGRHSMGLSNAAFYESGRFFWDERAATLEEQVLAPIQDSVEMGSDLNQLRGELAATEFYPILFNEAFGSPEVTDDKIADALAQFVRSMASYQSKYDQAREAGTVGSQGFNNALTSQEQLGSTLFHGTGRCNTCHTTDAQIGNAPRNIGLDADNSVDAGAGDGLFKVPSLRNVEVLAGYTHDGRFTTLEEVIDFYSTGIQDNPNLDILLQQNGEPIQFNFSQTEKEALIAFLNTLTDATFLNSSLFSDPFVELPGDFDGSGLVDQSDLEFLQNSSGSAEDFLVWELNVGRSWEDLRLGAVPEPSTALLAIGAGLFLLGRRVRRNV